MQPINGPIPGANFTANTKNFPWHRPPQYTNMDDAVEAVMTRIFDDEYSSGFLTMLESGFTITQVTDLLVTSGIGKGMWTPDFAILLAGPVSHLLVIMAKGYDIDYDMGYEKNDRPITSVGVNKLARFDPKEVERFRKEAIGDDTSDPFIADVTPKNPDEGMQDGGAPQGGGGLAAPPSPEDTPPVEGAM